MAEPTPAYLFGTYLADFVAGFLPLTALYYAVKTVHQNRWYGALWCIGALFGFIFLVSDVLAFSGIWTLRTFFQFTGLLVSIGWLIRERGEIRRLVGIIGHGTSQ